MAGLWQRTGTVTVTNGSKTVTGSGTKWKTGTLPIQKGHTFYGPDNWAYEVDTVVSDTEILLVENYRGGTLANQAYRIDITRTSTISQFAADLASLVGKYRAWFDGMMTWLTGSGDVSILNPDTGANTTIPSWQKVASEGEGQAARAKTEADKAAASAALAGNIVVASALPLPDVWAPLSDSLRMITGFGRDVLVGSDVVARMANFSRNSTATYIGKDGQLRTAAANEPRFEKEGLLLEGQSSNLNPRSQQYNWPDGYGASPGVQSANTDPQSSALIPMIDVSPGRRRPFIVGVLTVGKTYTISFRAKSDGGAISQVASQLTGAVYPAVAPGEWKTYSFTGVATSSAVDFQITGTSVSIAWIQVEELPFASSYIPTNGAAVTRAAGACLLPYAGNGIPASEMQMTMSAVIKTNRRSGEPTALLDALDITPSVGVFLSNTGQIDTRIFDVQWNPGIALDLTKEQVVAFSFNGATGAVAMRVGDKVVTGTVVVPKGISRSAGGIGLLCRSGINTRTGFGSVRDFKIWHKFFTVDQLKAIK